MHGSCENPFDSIDTSKKPRYIQPTDKIDMIYNIFFLVCMFSFAMFVFFGLFDFFFPQTCSDREPFMPSRYLPHTLSNLLNRLTCISNICDSILISNGSIVSYLTRWEYTARCMYLYRFSAMFCLPIMYNNATTFPAHSENFNLKNANC